MLHFVHANLAGLNISFCPLVLTGEILCRGISVVLVGFAGVFLEGRRWWEGRDRVVFKLEELKATLRAQNQLL